jgi:hypothetical protein
MQNYRDMRLAQIGNKVAAEDSGLRYWKESTTARVNRK